MRSKEEWIKTKKNNLRNEWQSGKIKKLRDRRNIYKEGDTKKNE